MEIKTLSLTPDVTLLASIDAELRVFDIIMETEFGTTYNSYIVKGKDKTVIFETTKTPFWEDYLENLKKCVDLDKVDYIVANHTEPDHAGSIKALSKLCKNAIIVGSASAIMFIKQMANIPLKTMVVKTGDTIDIGGKTLNFISAPFLHWPDSMFTFIPEIETIFTCDVFGCHFADSRMLLSKINDRQKDYEKALAYYNAMIFGPFGEYVLRGIDSIKDLKIKTICTGHGPVLDTDIEKVIEKYKKWAAPVKKAREKGDKYNVFMGYVSVYGFTSLIGDKIKTILENTGKIEVTKLDVSETNHGLVNNYINKADGVLMGSCTINADAVKPVYDVLSHTSVPLNASKPAAAFGSFGWSGEGPVNLESRLRDLKFKIVTPALRVNFLPSEDEEKEIRIFAENFIQSLYKADIKPAQYEGVKKWKCIVCGEVYDGDLPPDICPACGVGADKFEEVVVEDITFSNDNDDRFVIIGGGVAGLTAAENIRLRNKKCSIVIFSDEEILPYYRPKLSEMLGEEIIEKNFIIKSKDWFQKNNIDIKTGLKISEIDTKIKTVTTQSKEKVFYDKLILANGSYCIIPAITGSKNKGVFSLRHYDDLKKIKEQLKTTKKCIVIGGGLLGLEAGWNIKKMGIDVSIIELSERILPYQLDIEASYIFEKIILEKGVNIIKGKYVKSILGNDKVEGIKFEDNEEIDADMVIFAIGICPNVGIIDKSGIKINRGVIVNEKMETSFNNIWACGDVAEYNGIVYGNWETSISMAKVAGANAANDNSVFYPPYKAYILNSMGSEVFSTGDIGLNEKNFHAFLNKDYVKNNYKKALFRNNTMTGAILIGDTKNSIKYLQGVKKGSTVKDFLETNIL